MLDRLGQLLGGSGLENSGWIAYLYFVGTARAPGTLACGREPTRPLICTSAPCVGWAGWHRAGCPQRVGV